MQSYLQRINEHINKIINCLIVSNKNHIEYIIFVKLFIYRPIEIQEEFFLNINEAIAADNNNNSQDFDKTIGNIVNVIVSYDMG